MADLGQVSWPPPPIVTERLILRESEPRDRSAMIELFSSSEVYVYLGGPQSSEHLEREMPEVPGRRVGFFVVDLRGEMIGVVTFDRREGTRPGHVRSEANEVEIGCLFLPKAWGCGYAT
ncbi:MAG: GNAT family N-acetyltransferase, partial [Ferrimicrobium sp.]